LQTRRAATRVVTLRTEPFSTATFCAVTERNAAEFGGVDLLKVRRCVARTRRLSRCCAGARAYSARRTTEVGIQQTNGQYGRPALFAHFPVRESSTSGALANGRPTLSVPIVSLLTSAPRAATRSTLNWGTRACWAPSRNWLGGPLLPLANGVHCSVEDEGGVFQG
jgi:hypothetical protein